MARVGQRRRGQRHGPIAQHDALEGVRCPFGHDGSGPGTVDDDGLTGLLRYLRQARRHHPGSAAIRTACAASSSSYDFTSITLEDREPHVIRKLSGGRSSERDEEGR